MAHPAMAPCAVDSLPTEILDVVLARYLDNTGRMAAAQVCHRWHDVISAAAARQSPIDNMPCRANSNRRSFFKRGLTTNSVAILQWLGGTKEARDGLMTTSCGHAHCEYDADVLRDRAFETAAGAGSSRALAWLFANWIAYAARPHEATFSDWHLTAQRGRSPACAVAFVAARCDHIDTVQWLWRHLGPDPVHLSVLRCGLAAAIFCDNRSILEWLIQQHHRSNAESLDKSLVTAARLNRKRCVAALLSARCIGRIADAFVVAVCEDNETTEQLIAEAMRRDDVKPAVVRQIERYGRARTLAFEALGGRWESIKTRHKRRILDFLEDF
ncbi:F-box incomplete domain containing protein [Pandoravirus salinus]|uniref:F-box incomplete domain containing protein n=1 Tax=Pandoravirus salinus TaxID=1349410 RepID=S4W4T1_9VIRU|nr:F-box incomplete domain [Pandoravirus salinus]AGO85737.1 F-box incomplete domain containing protein [Pandoravirus salinus]